MLQGLAPTPVVCHTKDKEREEPTMKLNLRQELKFFATVALAGGIGVGALFALHPATLEKAEFTVKCAVEQVINKVENGTKAPAIECNGFVNYGDETAPAGIPIGVETEVVEGKFYASSEPVPSTYTAECEYHRGAKQCLVNVTGANEFEAGFTLYEGSSTAFDHTGTRYEVTVNEANNGTTVLHLGNGYMAFNNTNATNFQF